MKRRSTAARSKSWTVPTRRTPTRRGLRVIVVVVVLRMKFGKMIR